MNIENFEEAKATTNWSLWWQKVYKPFDKIIIVDLMREFDCPHQTIELHCSSNTNWYDFPTNLNIIRFFEIPSYNHMEIDGWTHTLYMVALWYTHLKTLIWERNKWIKESNFNSSNVSNHYFWCFYCFLQTNSLTMMHMGRVKKDPKVILEM